MVRPKVVDISTAHSEAERLDCSTARVSWDERVRAARQGGTSEVIGEGVLVTVPPAELDLLTCPAWRSKLIGTLERADCRVLVVDLSQVEFFGVTGLGVLVEARRRAEQCGVTVCLVASSQPVWRLLEVTSMAGVFAVYGSRADALGDAQTVSGAQSRMSSAP